MQIININKYKLLSILIIACGINACGSSNGGGGANTAPPAPASPTKAEGVFISQSSIMPRTSGGSNQQFYVVAYNDTNETIKLTNASATEYTDNSTAAVRGLKSDLYNAAACSGSLAPQQTCLIGITPQGKEGGFVLSSDFKALSGKTYTARQIIQYGEVPAANGFMVNNNNLRVAKPSNQNYYITIPFVLDQNYEKVEITSQVDPLSQKILCSNEGYNKGNSCTAVMEFAGGEYSSKINFKGTSRKVQAKHALTSASSTETNVNFSSTSAAVPNLIHDGFNALVKSADTGPRIISILNTGLAAANFSSIVPDSANTVTVSNNSCNGELAVGSSCSFTLSTTTATHKNSNVTINYDGKATSFNFAEIAKTAAPGLILTTNGSLEYTVMNSTNQIIVNVSNASTTKTQLNELAFTSLGDAFSISNNTCGTALQQGESCNLTISYTPPSAPSSGTLEFTSSAHYTEADSKTGTITATKIVIPYSSVAQLAGLTITPSNPTAMKIRADNVESTTQDFTVSNNGDATASSLQVNIGTLPSAATVLDNTCTNQLVAGSTCRVRIKYGPTSEGQSSTTGKFDLTYKNSLRSDATQQTAYSQDITFEASLAALIYVDESPTITATDPSAGLTILGENSYAFYPTSGKYIELNYSYTNNGTAAADNFNVAVNYPGAKVSGSCPTGTSTTTLAVGASCSLTIEYIDDAYFQAFAYTAPVTFYRPEFTYTDNSTGSPTLITGAAGTVPVTVSLLKWADIAAASQTTDTNTRTIVLKYTLNSISGAAATLPVSITLPKLAQEGFGQVGSNTCMLTSASSECNITISYQSYMPLGTHYVEWVASAGGAAATAPLSDKVTVIIPN